MNSSSDLFQSICTLDSLQIGIHFLPPTFEFLFSHFFFLSIDKVSEKEGVAELLQFHFFFHQQLPAIQVCLHPRHASTSENFNQDVEDVNK